jgi:two-component system sensor histidine kinase MprB
MDCRADATTGTGDGRGFGPYEIVQVVNAQGRPCTVPDAGSLKVTAADAAVARGDRDRALHDGTGVSPSGKTEDVRILTLPARAADGTPIALSVALSLDEVEGPLDNLALLLVAVTALGVLVSAGAGLMIARRCGPSTSSPARSSTSPAPRTSAPASPPRAPTRSPGSAAPSTP